MPDQPTPDSQSFNRPWTAERIRENMEAEFGIKWAPPTPEETWAEDEVDTAEEWLTVDPDTQELRVLTPDELFDSTAAERATNPDLADVPRDHPRTERETDYLQSAMKEHGVPAEIRAQSRWEQRMDSMSRHPSMQPAMTAPPMRPQMP